MNPKTILLAIVTAILCLLLVGADEVTTEATTKTINWSGKDATGAALSIPAKDKVSILAFVRGDQPQSKSALEQIRGAMTTKPDLASHLQVLAIFSGEEAQAGARSLASATAGWPVVIDDDFALSGVADVHVWPTVVIVRPDGAQAAHLAGLSSTFASDVGSYVEFAAGRIDRAALDRRLNHHDVVADDAAERAHQRLQLAQRFLERGDADSAAAQLDEGLKLAPADPALNLAGARVRLLQSRPAEALAALDRIPAGTVAPWQLAVIRARALIALDRWPDARSTLPAAANALNPDPAEALYLTGLVHQHDADWPRAAECFRKAYESATTRPARP